MARHIRLAAWICSLLLTCCGAAAPDFRRLDFHDNRASAGGITVELAEPDNPQHPTAWQGPLKIVGRCTANISLITAVYASPGARYLIAVTYSGSLRYAQYIDLQSCRELWPARKTTSDITVAGDDLAGRSGPHWQLFLDQPPKQR